jgi:hypothetical protein
MQTVTGFEDLDHGARGHVIPGLLQHNLVQVGVKRPAQGVDGSDAEAAEDLEELRLNQGYPLDQRAFLPLLPGRLHSPLQVVQDREQRADEGRMRVAPLVGQIALDALLEVLEIGPSPLEQGEVLIPLLLGDRDPQGLRIKIGKMGIVEKPALESDFDQYPEKPGDFLNIATKYD